MLVDVCEDLCQRIGNVGDILYAIKNFHIVDNDIQQIREEYGKSTVKEAVLDKILGRNSSKGRKVIQSKFLASKGFVISENPYDNPRKTKLSAKGYFNEITDEKSAKPDIYMINADVFIDALTVKESVM